MNLANPPPVYLPTRDTVHSTPIDSDSRSGSEDGNELINADSYRGLCGRKYTHLLHGAIAFTLFSAAAVSYGVNAYGVRSDILTRSTLEVIAGGTVGWFFSSVLKKKQRNGLKSFVSDYATPTFLILSQVYLNLSHHNESIVRPCLYGFFNMYGGVALAAYIHSAVTLKVGQGIEDPLTNFGERQETHFEMLIDSSSKRLAFATFVGAIGLAAIITGAVVKEAEIIRDYGIILSASGVARGLSELLWLKTTESYTRQQTQLLRSFDIPEYSCGVRYYATLNRIFLVACHALPGAFIVAAEEAAKHKIAPLSYSIYALLGLAVGWNEHLRQTRFSEVPCNELQEVIKNDERVFPPKSLFGGVKWVIGVPCLLAFVSLTIAGYNPQKNSFEKPTPFVISSITGFAVALYAGYFFSEWARVKFSKEKDRIINSAYYWTHYSFNIPLVFIYIMQKMLINDEAIDQDGTLAGALSTLAYADLGWGLGCEASSRFDLPDPRIVSPLYFALFSRYFVNLLTGNEQ